MEPTLVRRILTVVVVACLVLAAGLLGWLQSDASRRAREVDKPAVGGILVDGGRSPEPPLRKSSQPGARRPPQPASVRKSATTMVPARGGGARRVHQVRDGETLYRIAKRYGVPVADLQRANGLASDLIRPGQLLQLPGMGDRDTGALLGHTYIWPVSAPVSSYFGLRWGRPHNGIDLAANHGDEVQASRSGEVLIAGTVPGYGETVILVHDDGSRTLYAHCSKLLVKSGQKVRQGQTIALVGSTGQSTGPHLHFEIIVNDQPLDPLLYLPKP
ncbi:MAG: peptidoglycan DD-metalloendopeptidase family protein [Bacillota bacterium]